MRIVSLLASGTELVCALGAGDRLVGRSHECDTPAWVRRLPACSAPTFDVSGTSSEIDALVRERLRAGEPLYRVDDSLLLELAPDVLITQTHCEVCAVSPKDVERGQPAALCRQQVVALRAGTLDGVLDGFREVARVLGLAEEGEALVAGQRARIEAISDRVQGLEPVGVACLEWIDPVFNMGNWGPELVRRAGGRSLLGTAGQHSAALSWERVMETDPEVLLVAPCGFGIERTLGEMRFLTERPGWRDLRAVRSGGVFVADGNLYFNRSGPSLVDSIEILTEILHPEEFAPRHQGTAWRTYPDR
jgi:iron complex transport system substrate-binding protein